MGASDTPTTISNQALSSIGNRSTIASLTEQSNEAIQANMWFNNTRDELLRMAPWDCAFNYNTLTLITATPGTPENPTNKPLNWNKTIEGTAVVGEDVEITIDIEAGKVG